MMSAILESVHIHINKNMTCQENWMDSVQFAYSFYAMGSGQSFWDSWSITFYNMVFTFFPVVLRAVFEVDVEIQSSKKTLK